MTYLCIIPARGGSKGVPGKNIVDVASKPLIAWSIGHALACPRIDRTVVSTEDDVIAETARLYGAEVPFRRPAALATDTAATEPALIHALEALAAESYAPDAVVLLQPTSPVRPAGALDAAIRLFEESGADSLLSVSPFDHFLWRAGDPPEASYDYRNRPRRQDIPPGDRRWVENGSIYITRTSILRKLNNRLGGKIVLFEMSAEATIEVDTPTDVAIVRAILSAGTGHVR